jgi:hypothetical protein
VQGGLVIVRDVNKASAYKVRVHRAIKEMYVLAYPKEVVEVKFNEDFQYVSHCRLSNNIQASGWDRILWGLVDGIEYEFSKIN